VIKPGTILNDIFAHEDMLPTLLAAARDPGIKDALLKGTNVGKKTFKVHLDGYGAPWPGSRRAHAASSFTSTTTARSSAFAMTSGRWCSLSSGARA
jgi:hypothetical protein